MEKVKLYIILAVAVLSLVVVGAILSGIFSNRNDSSEVLQEVQQDVVSTSQETSVTVRNHAYSPARLTIKKGTTVTWTNQDAVQHDITPDNPSGDWKQSNLLSRGQSYSVTFNETGTFTYFCTPHPEMTGSVTVVD